MNIVPVSEGKLKITGFRLVLQYETLFVQN